jgi:hypothetical protein
VKSLVFLFVPVLVVIVPLIVFGIYGWWRVRQLKREMALERSRLPHSSHSLPPAPDLEEDGKQQQDNSGQSRALARQRQPSKTYEERRHDIFVDLLTYYRGGEVIVLFLVHPDLTLQAFSMFACKQIGLSDDSYYLIADLNRQCYTSSHIGWVLGVAVPMLFLWVFGVPMAAYFLARSRVKQAEIKVSQQLATLDPRTQMNRQSALTRRQLSLSVSNEALAKAKKEHIRIATHQAREAVHEELVSSSLGFLFRGYRFRFWYFLTTNLLLPDTIHAALLYLSLMCSYVFAGIGNL